MSELGQKADNADGPGTAHPRCFSAAGLPPSVKALQAIDPDELSPKEALEELYALQRLLPEGKAKR